MDNNELENTNGKQPLNLTPALYSKGFKIDVIACDACGQRITPPMIIADKQSELWNIATKLHSESKIICGNPLLIVTVSYALVSNALIK